MAKIEHTIEALTQPICEQNGCYLYEVEYKKEGSDWFLRVYIDKEGGVDIDTCEAVSRALSTALDEADPIKEPYTLEVSSPGIERVLSRPWHFDKAVGSQVELKLFRPYEGKKVLVGTLQKHDGGIITVEVDGAAITFEKGKIAKAKIHFEF